MKANVYRSYRFGTPLSMAPSSWFLVGDVLTQSVEVGVCGIEAMWSESESEAPGFVVVPAVMTTNPCSGKLD